MKEYYALLDREGRQIAAVASANKTSYRNLAARVTFNEFSDNLTDAREIFRYDVRKGSAFRVTGREARLYARLLREKKELGKRLEKIEKKLGVK